MVRLLAAGLTVVVAMSAGVANATPADSRISVLCKDFQHIVVSRQGIHYVVRNDNYGRLDECLSNHDRTTNFSIVKSGAQKRRRDPVAYPNIFVGCSWGVCTPGSRLPLRAGKIRHLTTTWHTTMKAGGTWSAGYDIWFDRKPSRSGQSGGAELMIWLNARDFPVGSWPVVKVHHVKYYLEHWVTRGHGRHWNYIQFRRVHPTSKVTRLKVKPFIAAAERDRLINRKWWLVSVEAGFEIWRGGVGLGTTRYTVKV